MSIYRDGSKRTQPLSTSKATIIVAGQLAKVNAGRTVTAVWNPSPEQNPQRSEKKNRWRFDPFD